MKGTSSHSWSEFPIMKLMLLLTWKFCSIPVEQAGGGLYTRVGWFVQEPGERLLLILLRRDINRREMKSTIFHSLPKSTSDLQRIYSGWDWYCLLFILQVGEGLLTPEANHIQTWNLVVSCNPSSFLFLLKFNPSIIGVKHWEYRPREQHTALSLHIPVLGHGSLSRRATGWARTAPGSILVLQGQD